MKEVLDKLTTLSSYVIAISLIIILLITSIDINCFNKGFYKSQYESLHTAET